MKKGIIYNLNPFNNETDMSSVEYIIKKILAFILIYVFSAVLGEGVIIGILYGMGYDPMHGIMPAKEICEWLRYDGFILFFLVTLMYCRVVEKKKISSLGFGKNLMEYLAGVLVAVILLGIIAGAGCLCTSIEFCGFNTPVSGRNIFLWVVAFAVQGAAEEMMCRGFLLHTLKDKLSILSAILISSTAFVFPHLSSLFEADFIYRVIGIVNLYLVSVAFSLLVLWRSNVWIACGLHSAWNFILYVLMALSLSGSESISSGVVRFRLKEGSIFNGAEYGLEASVITTVVLGVLIVVILKIWKGRKDKDGIS